MKPNEHINKTLKDLVSVDKNISEKAGKDIGAALRTSILSQLNQRLKRVSIQEAGIIERIDSSIDFKSKYAADVRWDIVGRCFEILTENTIKKVEDKEVSILYDVIVTHFSIEDNIWANVEARTGFKVEVLAGFQKPAPLKLSDPITIINQGPTYTCRDCGSHNIELNFFDSFPLICNTGEFHPTGVMILPNFNHLYHMGT